MRLIDTHAHLDDRAFDADRAALIGHLHELGIGVLTVGVDLASSREAVRLAQRHRHIWAAVGIHPHDAKEMDAAALRELETLAGQPNVVAVGEIGLDYYRDLSPRDVQRRAFAEQIEMARRLNLPMILHNRESTDDLLDVLRRTGRTHRGVVHSFLGDRNLAETLMERGLYLGVGGPITYPANSALREAVARVPLDRLLLETDCPYLTPVPHRGTRNEPRYVERVAEAVAHLRGLSMDDVQRATRENASRLFGIPAA
ncbi:MAG: TatD family hydrolase [Candidatus Bipolaricaulota bacterium]